MIVWLISEVCEHMYTSGYFLSHIGPDNKGRFVSWRRILFSTVKNKPKSVAYGPISSPHFRGASAHLISSSLTFSVCLSSFLSEGHWTPTSASSLLLTPVHLTSPTSALCPSLPSFCENSCLLTGQSIRISWVYIMF